MIPKFRARDQRGNWHIGLLTFMFGQYAIVNESDENSVYLIDKETVGQSTGLKDKNGVEIFESDLVKVIDGESEEDSYISVVKNYSNEGYPAFDIEYPPNYHYDRNVLSAIMCNGFETIEVTGNVYDNPELLEVAE
ncbi:hypothetical protein KI096_001572 [Enterococcus faecalis]|nr:hypothetical protein [Enterococcus faecalis]